MWTNSITEPRYESINIMTKIINLIRNFSEKAFFSLDILKRIFIGTEINSSS